MYINNCKGLSVSSLIDKLKVIEKITKGEAILESCCVVGHDSNGEMIDMVFEHEIKLTQEERLKKIEDDIASCKARVVINTKEAKRLEGVANRIRKGIKND